MQNRLKNARKTLKLSQDYVAAYLGISRTSVGAIESGQRKVSADELAKLSLLYGVSADELLFGKPDSSSEIFSVMFSGLSEKDQKEILSLMQFKRRYKAEKGGI